MSTQENLEATLQSEFTPTRLEVINESHMHSVQPGSESHFKVVVVSQLFEGKSLIARHRAINAVIDMTKHGIHALALHPFTPEEWQSETDTQSPDCQGGFGK